MADDKIRAWFDRMAAGKQVTVLTLEFEDGSLTSITKGEPPLEERENPT